MLSRFAASRHRATVRVLVDLARGSLVLFALLPSCAGSPTPAPAPEPSPPPALEEPPTTSSTTATMRDDDASAAPDASAETDDRAPGSEPLAINLDAGRTYGPTTTGPGTLDPAEIQRVVARNTTRLRRCYINALAKDPNASAKVVISFVITEKGTVTGAAVERASHIPELDSCVAAVFVGVRFPAPTGGSVTVKIPFVFTGA